MTTKLKMNFMAAAVVLLTSAVRPISAHHAFSAEFDANKPMTLAGTVSLVKWQNPHVYVYLDVTDASGKVSTYALECNSVNTLVHKGWTRDALKKGDKVTISAFGAKDPRPLADGSIHGNAKSITFSDGKSVSAGSSVGDQK